MQNPPHPPKYRGHDLSVPNGTVLLSHAPTVFSVDESEFKPSSLFRVSWSFHTCFMATTTTQSWRTGTSHTTSLWRTSSLLSSTSPFVSCLSLHGQSQH